MGIQTSLLARDLCPEEEIAVLPCNWFIRRDLRQFMATDDLRRSAHALEGRESDYRPLLDLVGNSSFVLLGEGSHGTHDFYYERAEITKRLITEKVLAPLRSRETGPTPTV